MMMVFAEGNSSNVMNVLMKLVFDSFNLDEDDDSDDCQYICKGIRALLREIAIETLFLISSYILADTSIPVRHCRRHSQDSR